jgi:hypothetical protein
VKTLRIAKYSIIVAVVLILVTSSAESQPVHGALQVVTAAEGVSLSVDFGNGTISEFYDLNGSSVLEVTSSVLKIDVQWFGPLAYIRGIEGVVGGGESGWQYSVNGQFGTVAVNQYVLHDNDTISWVYSAASHIEQQDPSIIPGALMVLIAGLGFIAIVYIQTSKRMM